jgi:flavin-dependent dehydrogenase
MPMDHRVKLAADAMAGQAEPCDVLVIGGGPAGSTAAFLLAAMGRDTVLLEKDAHPRFHIGESLLPLNTEIFDRLGVRDAIARIGVFKPGAEFVSDETGRTVAFEFARAIGTGDTSAYQVVRSEFDSLLFAHARNRGARATEHMRVTDLAQADSNGRLRVTAVDEQTGEQRRFAPRFVLDASGRDTFMANRLKSKRANKKHNNAAVFAHYRGVEMRGGDREGYITVHLAEDGWFWMIPLPDSVMSVGFVGTPKAFRTRGAQLETFFDARLRASPTVSDRMQGATRISPVTATGNYAYDSQSCWGENYMMIGDAFAFIDPMFSSGVLLAMTAGERGAEIASAWLDDTAQGRRLARQCERDLRSGMARISWLIYRINSPVLRDMFLSPSNRFRMRDGLVSLLSGNLRADPKLRLPVLAFKATYYALAALYRLGFRIAPEADANLAAAE